MTMLEPLFLLFRLDGMSTLRLPYGKLHMLSVIGADHSIPALLISRRRSMKLMKLQMMTVPRLIHQRQVKGAESER